MSIKYEGLKTFFELFKFTFNQTKKTKQMTLN